MGLGIRAQRIIAARAAARHAERQAKEKAIDEARARFEREFWDRERTAAELGISVHVLRRWQTAGKGPRPLKRGTTQQARAYWRAADVRGYLADPAGYEAANPLHGTDQ